MACLNYGMPRTWHALRHDVGGELAAVGWAVINDADDEEDGDGDSQKNIKEAKIMD